MPLEREGTAANVFISYRRDDASGYAGRIYDRLSAELGRDRVFMDVDGIPYGSDYVSYLSQQINQCAYVLALIGNNWLDARDSDGNRRLDNPADFVRIEITTALRRSVTVVPILLDGAEMPAADLLPEDLQMLTRRQALSLTNVGFHDNIERLTKAIRHQLDGKEVSAFKRLLKWQGSLRAWLAVLLAVTILSGGVFYAQRSSAARDEDQRRRDQLRSSFAILHQKLKAYDEAARSLQDVFRLSGERAIDPDARTDADLTKTLTAYNAAYTDLNQNQRSYLHPVVKGLAGKPALQQKVRQAVAYALDVVHKNGSLKFNDAAYSKSQEVGDLRKLPTTPETERRIRTLREQGAVEITAVVKQMDRDLPLLTQHIQTLDEAVGD
jgi:hypothetical protein